MAIKISALPLFIGTNTSTGDIPISIGGITYRVKSNQLNTFSLVSNSAVITDGTGNLTTSLVSATELFALNNITGNVQTQLNAIVASIPTGTTNQVQDVIVDGVTGFAPSQNAVYDALVLKANTASPALGGIPTTPTPASGDSSLQIANTEFVNDAFTGITSRIQNSLVYDGTAQKIPTVDGVNDTLTKMSVALINTGFADATDFFELYVYDNFTIGTSASTIGIFYKSLLQQSPYVLSNSILQVPATTISLSGIGLTGDGKFVKFLGYNDLGQFEFSDSTFFGSQSVAQLGILLLQVSSGVTTFLTNSSGVITSPSVAAYDNFESTVIGVSTSVNIIPSASTLSVDNTAGTIKGISVNWGGANNDELQVSAHTPLSFFQVSPVDLTNANVLTATTIVDTTQYYNGSILVTLGVSSASIQRFIMTINGHFYLQYGEHEFSNLTDAVNSIDIATFTNILPNNSYVEICRVAVTKGASDLANTSQAVFRSIKTSTGGGPGNAPVWGSINGNINDQFDLATILATKYQGTGTTNTLPKIGIPGQLVNSNILDTGSLVNIASNLFVNGTIAVNTGLSTQFLKADGSIDSTTYVQGSGSIGNITKWSSLNGISDSNLFDSGTAISATTDMYINQIRVGRGQGNDDTNTIVGKATLSSNVSGGFNSALGRATLASNISGGSNVAIGYAVLNSANASENTGVGGSCLFSNIIGDKNTAIGSQALNPLTGGTGNIGIGYAAGFFRDGGNGNKNSSHSIFIGYNSRSFSAAQTNEIVIGDIGVGMGSNTTVIGNSSTTNARIFGALTADTISKVSGTASQFLMADGTVTEYKEYTAVINTAGTVITPAVLYNTIGSIVWSNIGTGRWQGVLSGAFLLNKCTFLANNGNGSALGIVNVFRIDDNTIRLQTYDLTGTPANDIINQGSLTIRVFP